MSSGNAALHQKIDLRRAALYQEMAELRRGVRTGFRILLGFMFILAVVMIGGFITMANLILRIPAN